MRVLLVQIRQPNTPMAHHEIECIERRLARRPVELIVRNVFDTEATEPWLQDIDAVIIGGSGNYSVNDDRSEAFTIPLSALIDDVIVHEVPCFGICFGHQLLGAHLGRPVLTDALHSEVGTIECTLTAAGELDPVFGRLEHNFRAVTGHTDHVDGVPGGVTLLATSPSLTTQAFVVDGLPFYSTQFHPDLTGAEARERYLSVQTGLGDVNPDATAAAVERYDLGADEATVLLGCFIDAALSGEI